jgi:diadenosine tetraphosphate (Ap4A) HIT family hydrolase
MDLYPMLPGHVLVIPLQHAVYLEEVPAPVQDHLMKVGKAVMAAQKQVMPACCAHNLFINDGPAANQHVPHVHLHVLPRQGGDLYKALWSFGARYAVNLFGMAAHRRQLDSQALGLSRAMPKVAAPQIASTEKA